MTGIEHTLVSGSTMHLVVFSETTQTLYYVKFDTQSNNSLTAISLYSGITELSIRETIFAGATIGTINNGQHTGIKQAYAVGSAT